jgi:hypothetical protein
VRPRPESCSGSPASARWGVGVGTVMFTDGRKWPVGAGWFLGHEVISPPSRRYATVRVRYHPIVRPTPDGTIFPQETPLCRLRVSTHPTPRDLSSIRPQRFGGDRLGHRPRKSHVCLGRSSGCLGPRSNSSAGDQTWWHAAVRLRWLLVGSRMSDTQNGRSWSMPVLRACRSPGAAYNTSAQHLAAVAAYDCDTLS